MKIDGSFLSFAPHIFILALVSKFSKSLQDLSASETAVLSRVHHSVSTDTLYRTSHFVWWWSAVWWEGQNDFIQGADILYEHAPFQEVPRSFQMIGVDTELCR